MDWTLAEAISYYKTQNAPKEQTALVSLLREIQQKLGSVPAYAVTRIAQDYALKESYLLALIRRIPSLRLENTHCLQVCAGPNCGKHTALAACAEALRAAGGNFTLEYIPCQRMCGKGPNIKWDGALYHQATEELLKTLIESAAK